MPKFKDRSKTSIKTKEISAIKNKNVKKQYRTKPHWAKKQLLTVWQSPKKKHKIILIPIAGESANNRFSQQGVHVGSYRPHER